MHWAEVENSYLNKEGNNWVLFQTSGKTFWGDKEGMKFQSRGVSGKQQNKLKLSATACYITYHCFETP